MISSNNLSEIMCYDETKSKYGTILNKTYIDMSPTNKLRLLLVFIENKFLLEVYTYLDLVDISKAQFSCKLFANSHLPKYLRFELLRSDYAYRSKIYLKEYDLYHERECEKSQRLASDFMSSFNNRNENSPIKTNPIRCGFFVMRETFFYPPKDPGPYPDYQIFNDSPEGKGFIIIPKPRFT